MPEPVRVSSVADFDRAFTPRLSNEEVMEALDAGHRAGQARIKAEDAAMRAEALADHTFHFDWERVPTVPASFKPGHYFEFYATPDSRTEEPAVPDQSHNPYDRRQRNRDGLRGIGYTDGGGLMAHEHGFLGGGAQFVPGPRALAIEDLDAMASSAHQRGEVRAQERLMEAHRIELQAARREAWDEGRAQGEQDGRQAMLRRIDDECGATVRDRHAAALDVLSRYPNSVTKGELHGHLDTLVTTLGSLIHAHHCGFAPGEF